MTLSHKIVLALFIASALALPDFKQRIPNGEAWLRPDSGITCEQLGHTPCEPGATRNAFGLAFKKYGFRWTKELCEEDSDGDGLSNGEELGDPCCRWPLNNPIPLRRIQLSHPGDANEDGAKNAPTCAELSTKPPVTTVTTTTTTETTPTTLPPTTSSVTTATTESTTTNTEAVTTTPATTILQSPSTSAEPGETEAPSPTPDEAQESNVCFPAHATVRLENGSVKKMSELNIGDRVQVGPTEYSPIFLFTHKLPNAVHAFITIHCRLMDKASTSVTLTSGHYLYVNGRMAPAESVRLGDYLELASGDKSIVVNVSYHEYHGLYNPQTEHGDLIVDSVRVSTYTTAVNTGTAHALLVPLRLVYTLFGWTTSALETGATREVVALLP